MTLNSGKILSRTLYQSGWGGVGIKIGIHNHHLEANCQLLYGKSGKIKRRACRIELVSGILGFVRKRQKCSIPVFLMLSSSGGSWWLIAKLGPT